VDKLPEWERGTPAVLCVGGPHPIPVTTPIRAGDQRILLALGRQRETLRRLRDDPDVAFCLLGRDLAFTAHCRASVIAEELDATDTVVAVELRVESLQDHLADGRTFMLDGARWRWTEQKHGDAEDAIVAELRELAAD